jgi:hypothetical protein
MVAPPVTSADVVAPPSAPATDSASFSDVTTPFSAAEAGIPPAPPAAAEPAAAPAPNILSDASEDLSTRAFRISDVLGSAAPEILGGGPAEAESEAPSWPEGPASDSRSTAPAEPSGRTLGDLYYAQGHYTEALRIYDDLVASNPFDTELKRLRRDAEARLLPAASSPGLDSPEPGMTRRLARVRALKRWLAVVQAG